VPPVHRVLVRPCLRSDHLWAMVVSGMRFCVLHGLVFDMGTGMEGDDLAQQSEKDEDNDAVVLME